MRRLAMAAAALLAAVACGPDDTALGRAEDAMADLDAGELLLELSATTPGVEEPVGFRVDGRFQHGDDSDLPVLDFEYTELLAGEETTASVIADGTSAWVVLGDEVIELADDQVAPLRLGSGEGFADIGIASWVEDPEESGAGGSTTITGAVDVADLLSDLSRLASQVAGSGDLASLDDAAAGRLAALVRSSAIEVVIGDDDLPRTVDATVDFGAEVPDDLVDALGPYAAASLRLVVELAPLEGDLTVEPPR